MDKSIIALEIDLPFPLSASDLAERMDRHLARFGIRCCLDPVPEADIFNIGRLIVNSPAL